MKIQRIESFARPEVALVRVTAEDGLQGWGQVAPYHSDLTAAVLHRQVAPHALGQSADDLMGLETRILEAEYKFPGSHVCRALGGLDTALWDLAGKRAGKSVCEMLDGRPRPVPVYGSSMRRDIGPEEEGERLRRLAGEQGYRAFKFRIGVECGHDGDAWPGRTEAIVPAVRRALGDDCHLMVDANSCYTPAKAIQVAEMLAEHGISHYEEPCPYWELEWTAQVREAVPMDVTGGEQDCMMGQWRRMLSLPAVDIAQPDVCYIGGLTRTIRVFDMAAAAGLPCIPHSANHTLVTVFSLHLMGAHPNAGPHVEFSIEDDPWARGVYEPVLVARDGKVQVPDGPGWGVEIAEDWLAGASHAESVLE